MAAANLCETAGMKAFPFAIALLCLLPACEQPEDTLRITLPACRPPHIAQGVLSIGRTSFEPFQVQASATRDAMDRPALSIRLDEEGAEQLESVTRANIGETLPLRVDEDVIMSPRVLETITGGEILVSGDFEAERLEALALRLSPPCDEETG